ncbi:YcaO-like family protein [Pseudoalteromonas sp. MMG012]|uniref:YcaO-like family protein n=1 Tax=Pseudoalteromonas sp. MMG012 TaxID=2822686 RepID=UPI001B39F318|nr:YcaO-like family protein [Pseudoalteromonas sp. MMG012]MBQ4850216.1 YcaO-like family protein [Pseudoalteromonas sp. MMG012]
MTKNTLHWHPKFTVLNFKKNILSLSSTQENLLLSIEHFPLIQYIDGSKTELEIINKSTLPADSAKFIYFLKFLIDKNIILRKEKTDKKENYKNTHSNSVQLNDEQMRIISKFRDNNRDSKIILTKNIHTLDLNIKNSHYIIIIEFNYDTLIISPKLDLDSIYLYLERRKENLPLLTYNELYAPSSSIIRNSKTIASDLALKDILTVNPQLNYANIIEINRRHKVHFIKENINFLTSTHKVQLKNQKAHFNQDGGSRSISPSSTVENLQHYVNCILGYINQLSQLTNNNNFITIFSSSFFKTPKKSIENMSIDDFNQACLGKGVTEEQSKASALCEAIERKNAQYCGNEQYITKQAKDLPHRYTSFDDISPYSDTQYQHFSNKSHSDSRRKQAAVPYSHNEAINWQLVWSLTCDEAVYVPSVLCFANTPFHDDIYGKWNSNGCAAGNNLEEAILQALFELIERDATAIWWYNRLIKPSFDLSRLNPDYLAPLDQTLREHHDYWVLDLTIDTGVAVMAAIGKHKTTQGWIFGFGCHLKPEMAAQRALTELCQLIPIRDQNGAPFDFDAISDDDFLNPHDATAHGAYTLTQSGDLKDDIIAITEQLKLLGLETLVLDYTRQPLPIHTAKVFVPGLCHIWPQLGNARLYQTPVKLGWLEEPLNEQTINQQGLYI